MLKVVVCDRKGGVEAVEASRREGDDMMGVGQK